MNLVYEAMPIFIHIFILCIDVPNLFIIFHNSLLSGARTVNPEYLVLPMLCIAINDILRVRETATSIQLFLLLYFSIKAATGG